MSIRHGATLTLLRTPETKFKVGALGRFDSGTRAFLCLASMADFYLQKVLRPGESDLKSLRAATGGDSAGYPQMLILDGDKENLGGGEAKLLIRYEGSMGPKVDAQTYKNQTYEQSMLLYNEGSALYIPTRELVSKPTIVHKRVVIGPRPSMWDIGLNKTPPGISARENNTLASLYDDFRGPHVVAFKGWRLADRLIRAPGDRFRSTVWEVDDVYEWTVVEYPDPA